MRNRVCKILDNSYVKVEEALFALWYIACSTHSGDMRHPVAVVGALWGFLLLGLGGGCIAWTT
jgi:hypothetical protein